MASDESDRDKKLDEFIQRYAERTRSSKSAAIAHARALTSPVRLSHFNYRLKEIVYPIVSKRAEGPRFWDVDGNEYLDFLQGFGVNLFGHAPAFVNEAIASRMTSGWLLGPQAEEAGAVADAICEMVKMDRVFFCNSGTEAVLAALRIARTVTERSRIALFTNSFHGWYDNTLVRPSGAGDGTGRPGSMGLIPGVADSVLVLDYGTDAALEAIRVHGNDLAAILVEPVQSRHPGLQPRAFLEQLRILTREHRIALIFDEMVTGFRLGPRGAQGYYGVDADLAAYGKILGGGLPIGVVAGSAEFMDAADGGSWTYGDGTCPYARPAILAGTFSKHPLALTAARAVIEHIRRSGPALYEKLEEQTSAFVASMNELFRAEAAPVSVSSCASMFGFEYRGWDPMQIDVLNYLLMHRGFYVRREGGFVSTSHTQEDFARARSAMSDALRDLRGLGLLPT